MVKIAIHQPNYIPWFPFFYKMAMADKFIILNNVQFEKNGYQNRYMVNNKWITKPVQHGLDLIMNKKYESGKSLNDLNMKWINVIKETLEINTEIVFPKWGSHSIDPTERLIMEIKLNYGDTYITNPEAKNKYLNEHLMKSRGIDIEYCKVPKNLQKHTFEIFEEYGIEGAIKQLPKRSNEIANAIL